MEKQCFPLNPKYVMEVPTFRFYKNKLAVIYYSNEFKFFNAKRAIIYAQSHVIKI